MEWLRKHHRYVAIVSFAVAIISYFLQIVYFATFLIDADSLHYTIDETEIVYTTTLLVFLVVEMMICLAIVGYSGYSIYRAIFDDDETKEGPDVMFLAFLVGILYLANGLQYASYYIVYKVPIDGYTIATLTLACLTIEFYIILLAMANLSSKKHVLLRYVLRGIVMLLATVNVALNIAINAQGDAFAIIVSSFELLVPLSVGFVLVSEA